ncbi:MAG: carbohydrate binding domain-containing protein [Planctomycetota bacterium]
MKLWLEQLEPRINLNGTSILPDGDFETSVQEWGAVFGSVDKDSDSPYEGQFSLQSIDRNSNYARLYREIKDLVREGVEYEVTVMVRVDQVSGQQVNLGIEKFVDGGYEYVNLESRANIRPGQWLLLAGKFKIDSLAGFSSLKIKIDGPDAGVSFKIDDVRLSDPGYRLNTNLISNGSFESNLNTWFTWSAQQTIDQGNSYQGSSSNLVSNRTNSWSAIATDIRSLLQSNLTYRIDAKVRVDSADNQAIQLGIAQADSSGTTYHVIEHRNSVPSDQWLSLSGEFTFEATEPLQLLELYINGPAAGVDLNVDDVVITPLSILPDASFESGTYSGQSYATTIEIQQQVIKSGQFALKSSNRTDRFGGPLFDVLPIIQLDQDYQIGSWVRVDGNTNQSIRLGIKQVDDRGTRYVTVDEVVIPPNEWVWLEGGFRFSSVGTTTSLQLQYFLPDPGVSFFVDDIKITQQDWITESEARIEHFRKRDLWVQFVDDQQQPIENVQWEVRQIENEFAFGTAVNSQVFTNDQYREFFLENFNWATIEYEIQWQFNEPTQDSEQYEVTDQLVQFLNQNDIPFRAHSLFWGEDIRRPAWLDDISDEELFQQMIARVAGAAGRYAGQIAHWDVNNEMVQNSYFTDRLGDGIRKWMFEELKRIDPAATLMTNEYFALAYRNTYEYLGLIEDLLSDGVPLDAIGIQSHFSTDTFQNPSPTGIRNKLDKFDDFGLPVWITEFDSKNAFVVERAKDVDAFYRAIFSHPGIDGSVMWGFWEGNQWNGRGPLVDLDFTVNEAGQAFLDLREQWTTFESGITDDSGVINLRGFHGDYQIKATLPDGRTFFETIELTSDSQLTASSQIPIPVESGNQFLIQGVGESGNEIIDVYVNDIYVQSIGLSQFSGRFQNSSPGWQTFYITAPTQLKAGDVIRLEYNNDGVDAFGVDSNVRIDYLSANGKVYQSESPDVLASGVYQNGSCQSGFLESEFLNCDGFLEFTL